jgi:hypothetical protein
MRLKPIRLVVTLALVILVVPLAAGAQQSKHVPRIGILAPTLDPHDPSSSFQAFRQGLRDLGYVEGQSIALEYRVAEGKVERLPELAAELVRLKVDLIFALGGCPRITLNASWGYVESCGSWVKPGAVSTWEGKRTPHTDPDGSRSALVHPYAPADLDEAAIGAHP